MYFAILGRHPKLSLAEIASIDLIDLDREGQVLFFHTTEDERLLRQQLAKLGGIVKRGVVVEEEKTSHNEIVVHPEITAFLSGISLIGVNEQKLGMELKKLYGMRRFKLVDLQSADLDVKNEGKELIDLHKRRIGLVMGRQDIAHFEQIDFGKPMSGMEVGMMPAKLAQILVNIGVSKVKTQESTICTVYDPFCGFGTTGFVANWLGHHFVGSDLHITACKENQKRRRAETNKHNKLVLATSNAMVSVGIGDSSTSSEGQDGKGGSPVTIATAIQGSSESGGVENGSIPKHFTVFKHDATTPFDNPLLKHVDVVVTEGRLGPVVSKKTREPELRVHAEKIIALYSAFLDQLYRVLPDAPIVITIPTYTRLPDLIPQAVVTHAQRLGYSVADFGIYSRKGQEVCRQVVVFHQGI